MKKSGLMRQAVRTCTFLLPMMLSAGQSLVLPQAQPLNVVDPSYSATRPWRVEFQLHNFVPPGANNYGSKVLYLAGLGTFAALYPDGTINFADLQDYVPGRSPCSVPTNNLNDVLVRFQRDLANNRVTCELWNFDGTSYNSQIEPITGPVVGYSDSGGNIGVGVTGDVGFMRIFTTVVPMGSRPPTTADHGDWTELKFDGNLSDSSGHGHIAAGPATYVSTPDQVAIALPKTLGAPSWSNWLSLRAGFPAQLDGTSSYSMADASSAVSYFWQQLSGPSTVVWGNRTQAKPVLNGLLFGTYSFSLKVTDAAGNTATAPLQAGAVATDNNGVVINADPDVDRIFGPMIAFGKNPWGWMDERALRATTLRSATYNAIPITGGTTTINPPTWQTPAAGTVSYVFNNNSGTGSAKATTLAAAVTSATQTSIQIADASQLDLSALPTRILIGGFDSQEEEVRVCSATGSSGPQTLTVCYDGRGYSSAYLQTPAHAWGNGTPVSQLKMTGSGTSFVSTLCPSQGGVAPYVMGPVAYATGTVTATAGLSLLIGDSTAWATGGAANAVNGGYLVRVQATHGGTPFAWIAFINAVDTTAQTITASRVFPPDADSGTYTYQIINDANVVPSFWYRRADGSTSQITQNMNGCEDALDAYVTQTWDIATLNGTAQTGMQYATANVPQYGGAFGINFYGEDLAHRALYYRSGWAPAIAAANLMSSQWATSPYLAGGDAGGIPLNLGGGVIGAIAGQVLANQVPQGWANIRGFLKQAESGIPAPGNCNSDDVRDHSYRFGEIALAAQFDPNSTFQAEWKTDLGNIYNWEVSCRRSDNSWANAGTWGNLAQTPLNLTAGSATATGTGFTTSTCPGVISGVITVTNGSATATGSFFSNAYAGSGGLIVIEGTSGGKRLSGFYEYAYNSETNVTLSVNWPGDSGTFPYIVENGQPLLEIGQNANDPELVEGWGCTYNTPTQITLSRPWDGPNETAYLSSSLGYAEQPYMMGIKTNELRWASQVSGVNPTGFATLEGQAATWVYSTGYDPLTQGLYYGRVQQICESSVNATPPASPLFDSRTPFCNQGLVAGNIDQARALTGEGNAAIAAYYTSNPTAAAKAWGDTIYGSVWGYGPYTAAGFYSDPYQGSNLSDTYLAGYKWTGFYFGMGMAHQWPAARVGGAAPPKPRSVYVSYDASAGASAKMFVTAPSGAVANYICMASPCAVQVDDRQGSHWLTIQYLSAEGKVVSQSTPQLLTAAQ